MTGNALTLDQQAMLASAREERVNPAPTVASAIALLRLQPGNHVLDAGCGAGAHLGLLADLVGPTGTVIGVDADVEALAVARELWRDDDRISFVRAAAETLPLPDNRLDGVWCSAMLHHAQHPLAVLQEFIRVLRPGGRLVVMDGDSSVSFPNLPWPLDLDVRLRSALQLAIDDGFGGQLDHHYHPLIGRSLLSLFAGLALDDISLQALADTNHAPLTDEARDRISGWFFRWFIPRIDAYLTPDDLSLLRELVAADGPRSLLTTPGFYQIRTWLVAAGTVSSPTSQ